MNVTKATKRACLMALSLAGVAGLSASRAQAATLFFDTNGTTAGLGTPNGQTFDWDATTNGGLWDTVVGGNGTISGWVQGDFPEFDGGAAGQSYIVTVSNDEQVAGMFNALGSTTLTINASGSGDLNMASGLQGVLNSTSSNFIINAPITGAGEIQCSNGGNIFLNGVNTFTGGTNLSSTGTLINFNNNSSFGTNFINMGVAGFVPLLGHGGATITLPNNFTSSVTGAGINFAADANTPVICNGTWTLGANNLVLRNNGVSTSPLTLTGKISGTANIALSGANGGAIILTAANSYSGTTTVGVSGATSITLKLGAANTIASSSSLILAGGALDPDNFNQAMTSTTLGLTAASTLTYASGSSEVDFANSSAVSWTGATLNLASWNAALDKLKFGIDTTGLTSTQLAKIEFNGAGLGTASLDPNGFVIQTPEPTMALLLAGAPLLLRRRRGC